MGEVRIAFPNERGECGDHRVALRSEGIAARVDRGLSASYQAWPRNQIIVLVERTAREARAEGTRDHVDQGARIRRGPCRVAVIAISVMIALGVVVIIALLRRAKPRG